MPVSSVCEGLVVLYRNYPLEWAPKYEYFQCPILWKISSMLLFFLKHQLRLPWNLALSLLQVQTDLIWTLSFFTGCIIPGKLLDLCQSLFSCKLGLTGLTSDCDIQIVSLCVKQLARHLASECTVNSSACSIVLIMVISRHGGVIL